MDKKLLKNLIPLTIAVVGILVIGTIIFVNQGERKKEAQSLSAQEIQEIAEKTIDFINKKFLGEGVTASLIDTSEEYGLIKLKFEIAGNEIDSYVSKDGKAFFPEVFDLDEIPIAQEPENGASGDSSQGSVSPEESAKFINCLKESEFVIYGANWCGWTKKLVETLGGWDIVKPIYVECTEEEELCEEKEIGGFPTILLNGKEYQGARTFEEFAAATGCGVPVGAESVSTGDSSGGCE